MLGKNTLLQGALILIVALAVLQSLQPAIVDVDTSTFSGWQTQVVAVVQHFFTVTPLALLAGFAWSLFGFLRYKLGDQTVQFEVDKLYSTWMWFEGIIIVVAAGFPLPLSTAIAAIIMAVKSVLNTIKTPQPLPTAPSPQDPSQS